MSCRPVGSVKSRECSWALISVQRVGDTRSSCHATHLFEVGLFGLGTALTHGCLGGQETTNISLGMCSPLCVILSEEVGLLHLCEWVTDATQTIYMSRQLMDNSSAVHSSSRHLPGQQQIPAHAIDNRDVYCVVNFSTTIASDGKKLTFKLINVI